MAMDDDGLPLLAVKPWAVEEKHPRLRRYIETCSSTRRKYLPESRPGKPAGGASYIELFSGPGRVVLPDGSRHDGSPLVAWRATQGTKYRARFTQVLVADMDPASAAACEKRLQALGADVRSFVGAADQTVDHVVQAAPKHGLNFAFLDPFNLSVLPFTIIEKLSKLKRIDLVIHLSTQHLQRQLPRFLASDSCELDAFAPGWRAAVPANEKQEVQRRAVFDHWKSLIEALGLQTSGTIPHVKADSNQTLYWLVQASREPIAHQFWSIAADSTPQRGLL